MKQRFYEMLKLLGQVFPLFVNFFLQLQQLITADSIVRYTQTLGLFENAVWEVEVPIVQIDEPMNIIALWLIWESFSMVSSCDDIGINPRQEWLKRRELMINQWRVQRGPIERVL